MSWIVEQRPEHLDLLPLAFEVLRFERLDGREPGAQRVEIAASPQDPIIDVGTGGFAGRADIADDLALAFVERAAENGMDVFRTFDALNDYRNFETVVQQIKKSGKHFQGCICYTLTEPRLGGEVYNLEYYVNKAKALEDMGADSICVKDMAGLMAPYDAYPLIKALKEAVKAPIHLHSHFTSGMSPMTHLKAIEAGVDIIDTCMTPYAYRTSHPAVEPLVMALIGTNRDTGFDIKALAEINDVLEKEVLPKYRHLLDDSKVSVIDINVLLHQTPGGMLSNLVNQLREMDALGFDIRNRRHRTLLEAFRLYAKPM